MGGNELLRLRPSARTVLWECQLYCSQHLEVFSAYVPNGQDNVKASWYEVERPAFCRLACTAT